MPRALKISLFLILVLPFMGCTPKPQEIVYGTDGCHFCRMTIVDAQHAAQLVTKKGKVFKFDAIECMVNHLDDVDSNAIALYLCNHYHEPQELIDATQATFLISKSIPSPMGEFLTAFNDGEQAQLAREQHQGDLYTWDQLLAKFNK